MAPPDEVNDVKLTPADRRILSILETHRKLSPTKIGQIAFPGVATDSARSMASRSLRRLLDCDLVVCQSSDAGDPSATKIYELKKPEAAPTWDPRAQLENEVRQRFHEFSGEGTWRELPRHHISIGACHAAMEILGDTVSSSGSARAHALAIASMLRAPQTRLRDESKSSFIETNLSSSDPLLHVTRAYFGYVDTSQRERRHLLYDALEKAWGSKIRKGTPLAKICGMLSIPIALRQNDELLRYRLLGKVVDHLNDDFLSQHIRSLALRAMNRTKDAQIEWTKNMTSLADLDEVKPPNPGWNEFLKTCKKTYALFAKANLWLTGLEPRLEQLASSWLQQHQFPARWASAVRAGTDVFDMEKRLNEKQYLLVQNMLGPEGTELAKAVRAEFPRALKEEPATREEGSTAFYSLSRSPGSNGIASLILDNQDSLGWVLLSIHCNALE